MLARLSLRARLLLGVVLLTALGLAAADVATYTSLRSFLFHRTDSRSTARIGHRARRRPGGRPRGRAAARRASTSTGSARSTAR